MVKKLRILEVCAVGFTAQKLLLPLIDEIKKYYDVTLLCSRDEYSENLKNKGYSIKNVKIDRKISPFSNFISLIQIYFYLKTEKFDVVHTHTPVAGLIGRLAAKLAGVPVIIYTAHGFYFHDNMNNLKKKIYVFFEKIGGKISHYIFTQSREDYNVAIDMGIIAKNKITVIGNGVDIQKFCLERVLNDTDKLDNLKKSFSISKDDKVVSIIGRIVKEKGYIEWINAANIVVKRYNNVKFLAIGDTLQSDRDGVKIELDKLIYENGLNNNIIFAGSREDIPELLAITDVFTLPSYREGMPRSIIEAMSMSKCTIATDIRGSREEIEDGITGFIIPVGDYNALAEKIIYLIEHSKEAIKMGKSARIRAENEFDESKVIKKQLEIIEKLAMYKI